MSPRSCRTTTDAGDLDVRWHGKGQGSIFFVGVWSAAMSFIFLAIVLSFVEFIYFRIY